jgi:hypothetical protein
MQIIRTKQGGLDEQDSAQAEPALMRLELTLYTPSARQRADGDIITTTRMPAKPARAARGDNDDDREASISLESACQRGKAPRNRLVSQARRDGGLSLGLVAGDPSHRFVGRAPWQRVIFVGVVGVLLDIPAAEIVSTQAL